MNGEKKVFYQYIPPECFKTKNFNRFHCHKFIAICRSLFISFDDILNAHIRGCYCMIKLRVVPVLILFYGSGFVASPASGWTGRCFDKVLCLVNVDDKNLDSQVSIVLGNILNLIIIPALQAELTPEQASC